MARYLGFEPTNEREYYFVGYNSEDAETLKPILQLLGKELPLWYDCGIPYGENWRKAIADKIENSSGVFIFISNSLFNKGVNSYVYREYTIAKEHFQKQIYLVLLEQIEGNLIPNELIGWWYSIRNYQLIERYGYDNDELFVDSILRFVCKKEPYQKTYDTLNIVSCKNEEVHRKLSCSVSIMVSLSIMLAILIYLNMSFDIPISSSNEAHSRIESSTFSQHPDSNEIFDLKYEISADDSQQSNDGKDEYITSNEKIQNSITIGNLVNGGYVASDTSGHFYCAVPIEGTYWKTKSIIECLNDGSNKNTVYSAPSITQNLYHISCYDNVLVFNQMIDGMNSVLCFDLDKDSTIVLDACDEWSFSQLQYGYVYYVKNNILNRCSIDGSVKEILFKIGESYIWRIWNTNLISYNETDAKCIYVSNLDGSGQRVYYSVDDGYTIDSVIPVTLDNITSSLVVLEKAADKPDRVRMVTEDGQTTFLTIEENNTIERMCVYDQGIILTKRISYTEYAISAITFGGKVSITDKVIPFQGDIRYTSYIDGKIVFAILDDKNSSLGCMDFNTGGFNILIS